MKFRWLIAAMLILVCSGCVVVPVDYPRPYYYHPYYSAPQYYYSPYYYPYSYRRW
ncbi:MAG: hypothetical protein P4L42_10025 [Desulfocapsaceae bacterium]|nr:hypothetical protein [Desulfocapsaceae bacterium]